jgi:hypothetical protein
LNPTLQKSGLKREIKSEPRNRIKSKLSRVFVEPIKETQKILSWKKIVQKEEVNFY